MKKIALTAEEAKKQLNTKVKVSMDGLKAALKDPTKNSAANITEMINKAFNEIMSLIALIPVEKPVTTVTPAPVARADDIETKTPAFWRKNLDYGTK
jgi:hypothetical protein